MTYIEREALLEELGAIFFATDPAGDEQVGVLKCRKAIRAFPAADVALVKRAKWHQKHIYVAKAKGHSYCVWACSNCHKQAKERSNYCPNCGTDMRED